MCHIHHRPLTRNKAHCNYIFTEPEEAYAETTGDATYAYKMT